MIKIFFLKKIFICEFSGIQLTLQEISKDNVTAKESSINS